MPEHKDEIGIKDNIQIVLCGPDGKVKDERKPEINREENQDVPGNRPKTTK